MHIATATITFQFSVGQEPKDGICLLTTFSFKYPHHACQQKIRYHRIYCVWQASGDRVASSPVDSFLPDACYSRQPIK